MIEGTSIPKVVSKVRAARELEREGEPGPIGEADEREPGGR
jgi:hypothetical protein